MVIMNDLEWLSYYVIYYEKEKKEEDMQQTEKEDLTVYVDEHIKEL